MIYVPSEIMQCLVRDEIVDNQFVLKDQTVYSSPNRLFAMKAKAVKDISYSHISSVELETTPNWGRIIFGIIIVAMTFMPWNEFTPLGRLFMSAGTFSYFFTVGAILLGIFLIILGFKRKNHYIKLNVAGMSERLVLEGDKGNIGTLFRLINERRFQP